MNESNEENIRYENEIFSSFWSYKIDIQLIVTFLLKNLTIVRFKN